MGHGDEIIFSDAHFPANSMGPQVIRADGLLVSDLLQALIPLFELDSYAPPLVMMAAVEGDTLDPDVETRYRQALSLQTPARTSRVLTAMPFTNEHKRRLRSLSQESGQSTGIFFLKRGNAVISGQNARQVRAFIIR